MKNEVASHLVFHRFPIALLVLKKPFGKEIANPPDVTGFTPLSSTSVIPSLKYFRPNELATPHFKISL